MRFDTQIAVGREPVTGPYRCRTARPARTVSRIISRCMTLSPHSHHSAMWPVQTTFSCVHGPSLFSQGNRSCRLFGRNAGPNGCGGRDFPPQFAQRFSNLVMKLSTDLCLAGLRPLGRGGSKISLRPALTMWSLPSPRACLAPPILCYFGPTDCMQSRRSCKWSDA